MNQPIRALLVDDEPDFPEMAATFLVRADDQDIKLWTFKHENLAFASNPYVPGDRVIKSSHDDPNTAVVVEGGDGASEEVTVAYVGDSDLLDVWPGELGEHCEDNGIKRYSYDPTELEYATEDWSR